MSVRDEDITAILHAVGEGDANATDRLFALVHEELRGMARGKLRHERVDHTLQTTALVNEAYLRLAGPEPRWENRKHFFAAAAEAMRRILIDHARQKRTRKRSGGRRVDLDAVDVEAAARDLDLIALDEALSELEGHDPRAAQVVKFRYFMGLGVEETADLLEISPRTVRNDWNASRAWLKAALEADG